MYHVQVWDINKDPDVDALGGPFNLIMASNAVHTCSDMAGVHYRPLKSPSFEFKLKSFLVTAGAVIP